jgi:hypothetical protein
MAGKVHDTTGRFGELGDFADQPMTQISKKVKGEALETRRAAEKTETKESDAEETAKAKEGETDEKPPLR